MSESILIADDHPVTRSGLRAVLEQRGGFRVVGEAATGEEAVAKAQRLKPDIVLLDIRMPGISGVQACRQITSTVPQCRVIVLTAYAEDEMVISAIRGGASAYVLKRLNQRDLLQTIRRVSEGERIGLEEIQQTIARTRQEDATRKEAAFAALTTQELSVLALVAKGYSNSEIAAELYLGEGTVRNYVSSILHKIDLSNRAEAAAFAVRHHINEVAP